MSINFNTANFEYLNKGYSDISLKFDYTMVTKVKLTAKCSGVTSTVWLLTITLISPLSWPVSSFIFSSLFNKIATPFVFPPAIA